MSNQPEPNKSLYRKFLALEFGSLAILLGSLFWISQITQSGEPLGLFHRLVPAVTSGLTLVGFLGCMYVRWITISQGDQKRRRSLMVLFALLAISLLVVWLIAATQWLLGNAGLPVAG